MNTWKAEYRQTNEHFENLDCDFWDFQIPGAIYVTDPSWELDGKTTTTVVGLLILSHLLLLWMFFLQVHEARKSQLMHYALTSRKEKSESQEKAFAEKFQKRFADMAKREHEDHLKHFQVSSDSTTFELSSGTLSSIINLLIRLIHHFVGSTIAYGIYLCAQNRFKYAS